MLYPARFPIFGPPLSLVTVCQRQVFIQYGLDLGRTRLLILLHHYYSIAKARRDLGYSPKVSMDEGITRTLASLRPAATPATAPAVATGTAS